MTFWDSETSGMITASTGRQCRRRRVRRPHGLRAAGGYTDQLSFGRLL